MGAFGRLYAAGVLIQVPEEIINSVTQLSPNSKQDKWNPNCLLRLIPKFVSEYQISSAARLLSGINTSIFCPKFLYS